MPRGVAQFQCTVLESQSGMIYQKPAKDRQDTDFLGYNIIVTGVHSMQL